MNQRVLVHHSISGGSLGRAAELPADSALQRSLWPTPASAPLGVRWRIHDRTHLELPIEYQARTGDGVVSFEWDAYFFAPRSFRVDRLSHDREMLLADFRSYVRLSVPRRRLRDLAREGIDALQHQLTSGTEQGATRALRLFACRVRRAVSSEHRRASLALNRNQAAFQPVARELMDACETLALRLRKLVDGGQPSSGTLGTALSWVEEDVALMLEMLLSGLARRVKRRLPEAPIYRSLVTAAVDLAKHRQTCGFGSPQSDGLDSRQIEHIEFRRHTLKRFSSSVLWLRHLPQEPGRVVKQLLYALAAGVAMAFAVAATLLNGQTAARDQLPIWLLVAVVAYAVKDRLKASLQEMFNKLLSSKIPDRRWLVRDPNGKEDIAKMEERTRFVDFEQLPEPVLQARRVTRQHPMEEVARPETVLWHRKLVTLDAAALRDMHAPSAALLEVFRLDVARWLTHTDDPKQHLIFADPDAHAITSVVAPRVYNVAIVFRMRRVGDETSTWHRVRVVVSRKGLRRIEPIM